MKGPTPWKQPKTVLLGCALRSNEGVMKSRRSPGSTELLCESYKFIASRCYQRPAHTSHFKVLQGQFVPVIHVCWTCSGLKGVKILSGRCLTDLAAFLRWHVLSEIEILFDIISQSLSYYGGETGPEMGISPHYHVPVRMYTVVN